MRSSISAKILSWYHALQSKLAGPSHSIWWGKHRVRPKYPNCCMADVPVVGEKTRLACLHKRFPKPARNHRGKRPSNIRKSMQAYGGNVWSAYELYWMLHLQLSKSGFATAVSPKILLISEVMQDTWVKGWTFSKRGPSTLLPAEHHKLRAHNKESMPYHATNKVNTIHHCYLPSEASIMSNAGYLSYFLIT